MPLLKQLIPSDICLKCQVCCRFPSPESTMLPVFMKEEFDRLLPQHKSFFDSETEVFRPVSKSYHGMSSQACACPFFNPVTQECLIYHDRPLDCQLYPFVLTWGPTRKRVFLSLDVQCPFVQDHANQESLLGYAEYVRNFLEEKEMVQVVTKNPALIGTLDETIFPLYPLAHLTEAFFQTTLFGGSPPPSAGLALLTLKDRSFIEACFASSPRAFSEEAFTPLFVFSDLLRFYWKTEKETLFIIAEQGDHFFMPVPPVVKKLTGGIIEEGFNLLRILNKAGSDVRIEGFGEERRELVNKLGCAVYPKSPEYLYRRIDLVDLKGDAYKSKRSLCNFFSKNYSSQYRPYRPQDFSGCLSLFKEWQNQRILKTTDAYELALLEDAALVHRRTLLHAEALGAEGRVVTIGGEIKGYAFGYPLDEKTWCIFLEIADSKIKGIAQFLFREFCREKEKFTIINGMDDSGLKRLGRVKESYKPFLKKTPYVALRKGI